MTEALLKMDAPFTDSLLDRAPAAIVGTALPRIDGPRKVTGTARYAAEHFPEDRKSVV